MNILDNNKDYIINLHNIMNVNSIVIIEPNEAFLPIMHTKRKICIIKVAFIVEYQILSENMFP